MPHNCKRATALPEMQDSGALNVQERMRMQFTPQRDEHSALAEARASISSLEECSPTVVLGSGDCSELETPTIAGASKCGSGGAWFSVLARGTNRYVSCCRSMANLLCSRSKRMIRRVFSSRQGSFVITGTYCSVARRLASCQKWLKRQERVGREWSNRRGKFNGSLGSG